MHSSILLMSKRAYRLDKFLVVTGSVSYLILVQQDYLGVCYMISIVNVMNHGSWISFRHIPGSMECVLNCMIRSTSCSYPHRLFGYIEWTQMHPKVGLRSASSAFLLVGLLVVVAVRRDWRLVMTIVPLRWQFRKSLRNHHTALYQYYPSTISFIDNIVTHWQ
jgi:hypothetical protein